jgi:hypothetical protein
VPGHPCMGSSLFIAPLEPSPLRWTGIDLGGLGLPDGGTQFGAVQPVGAQGLVILVGVDTKVPRRNLSRLKRIPVRSYATS